MINYSLAQTYAEYVRALAIIESGENPNLIGDNGRAWGLLQQHPAFFVEYYGRAKGFPASPNHTWIEAQIVAAASFFAIELSHLPLDLAVQAYNLGMEAVLRGERAPDYLRRFTDALNRIRGEKKG